jgi:hypothetical protein
MYSTAQKPKRDPSLHKKVFGFCQIAGAFSPIFVRTFEFEAVEIFSSNLHRQGLNSCRHANMTSFLEVPMRWDQKQMCRAKYLQ